MAQATVDNSTRHRAGSLS